MSCPNDQLRYLNTFVYPVLMDGACEVAKQQPDDPVLELAQWLWRNNPNRPTVCAFPITLFDEIESMKDECRQWKMSRGLDSDMDLTQDTSRPRVSGLSVIDEDEEFARCPLNA